MSVLRAPSALRASPTAVAAAAGVGAAALTAGCLTNADLGRYVVSAVALTSAMTAAGLALFTLMPAAAPVTAVVARLTVAVVPVAFATALLLVAFDVMQVSGGGLAGLTDPVGRDAVLRGSDYQAALARCGGLVLIAAAVGDARPRARTSGAAGALLVCASFLLTGHARTHGPVALVVACELAHVVAASAWWGGLLGVGTSLRTAGADATAAGRLVATFATLMTGVVVMLLAAGAGLALLVLHPVSALVTTAYGRVLVVKIAVVAGILAAAAVNHRRLAPAAAAGDRRAIRMLTSMVTAEQIGLATVFVITSVLAGQNPNG